MKNTTLYAILLIGLALRLMVTFQPFQEDEFHWAGSAEREDWFGSVMRNSPLSIYVMQIFVKLFGLSVLSIRLPFILVGLLTIAAVYFFAKKMFGHKQAVIAAALLAFAPHHILASTQATYEGSFLTLFFFLTLAAIIEKKYLWSGIFFGLALLSKTSALVLLPPLIFFLSWKDTKFWIAIKITLLNLLAGLSIFFIGFGIPGIFAQSPAFINSIAQLISQTGLHRENFLLLTIQYANALIWTGPLLFTLLIFSSSPLLRSGSHEKIRKDIWVIIGYVVFFYAFVIQDNFPPMERYLMMLLPFLAILAADSITSLKWTKKNVVALGIVFCAAVIGGLVLQLQSNDVLPFSQKTAFIERALGFSWNFLVPISGSSGPVGFYLPFSLITLFFVLSCGATAISFMMNNKTACLLIVLGVGSAYSALFFVEYSTGAFHGSVPEAVGAVMTYANNHELPTPVYFLRNYALQYHLNEKYKKNPVLTSLPPFDYFSLNSYRNYNSKEQLKLATRQGLDKDIRTLSFADDNEMKVQELQGGTFLIIDFPSLNKNGPLFSYLETCNQTKVHEQGYVFVC